MIGTAAAGMGVSAAFLGLAIFGARRRRVVDGDEPWVLSAQERALVAAVADAFFPAAGPIPWSGTQAGILRYFDRYVRRSSVRQQVLIRLLLAFTELAPLAFGPRPARFTALSQDERLRALASAFTSRIYFRRVAFISLRALMTMAYLADERVARHIGMVAAVDPFGTGGREYEHTQEGTTP